MSSKGHTVTKKALLKSVREMPDQVSVEELIDRVLLLSKIERGLEQSVKGEVLSTADARKRLRKLSK
ncbi:MAG TPA: hypothetical protein PL070_20100 [Flavobacteriales bacterium]|nr:hypothetical protein [Flavobacteriales bacterium]